MTSCIFLYLKEFQVLSKYEIHNQWTEFASKA